ncbi:PAS domain S-box protein [Arenibaculum sp.]|uniref:PAS domain-containing sensor histidine kinase n=1 Tax=Arenibaculum sp. TaxID=2865862 RepID=UPI002E10B312|nr:PAS domain S-box protein [Arenibaculum sp.]
MADGRTEVEAGAEAGLLLRLPGAVLAWDAGGRIALANPAACALFGADPAGRPLGGLLPGLDPRADGTRELEALRGDGTRFLAEVALAPSTGLAGLCVAVVRDVEGRRLGEERLRDFAETASDWLWETGPDHRFTYISDASLAGECRGRTFLELALREPGDEEAWAEHHARLDGRVPFRDFQCVLNLRNAGTRYVSVSGRPVRGADGGFAGYRGSAADITEAVLWRRVRVATEVRLKAILDAAVDGIATLSQTGSIESFNPAAERIFGYGASEVIGRNIRMLVPVPFEAGRPDPLPDWIAEGGGRVVEGRREDGTVFPLELSVSQVSLEDGRLFVAILRDITERRRVERELEEHRFHLENLVEQRTAALVESEARLRSILAASTVPHVILDDADGTIRFANDSADRLFGFGAGEGGAETLYDRLSEREAFLALLARDGRVAEFEAALRTAQGGTLWASLSAIPMRFDGEACILISCTDISRRKEVELAMAAALEKEKTLNEQQQRFFSMASHEFRTPLTIIDAVVQMLARFDGEMDAAERRSEYDNIRAAVARMTNLMESVLSSSRAEAGTLRLNLTEVELHVLVREAVKRQGLIAPGHRIDLDIAALPSTVTGDARLLDQVLSNLLSNAVKYSPEGRPIQVVGSGHGGVAVIEVRDRGVGIPKAELPSIFRKYFRASTGAAIAGTGIGLHLVKMIVDLHGGVVGVDSVEGAGSTFVLRLPVAGPPGSAP